MDGLKSFIETNIGYGKGHIFYTESFGNLTYDYLGSVGYEITKDDKRYLEESGYTLSDFEDDGHEIIVR